MLKNFRTHQRSRKLNTRNILLCTYYVIERELNYRRVRNFFNTNISHTNIFNTKIFQTTVIDTCTCCGHVFGCLATSHKHYRTFTLRRPVYKNSSAEFFTWMCESIESCDYPCTCNNRISTCPLYPFYPMVIIGLTSHHLRSATNHNAIHVHLLCQTCLSPAQNPFFARDINAFISSN